jgi:hypothetical protein
LRFYDRTVQTADLLCARLPQNRAVQLPFPLRPTLNDFVRQVCPVSRPLRRPLRRESDKLTATKKG